MTIWEITSRVIAIRKRYPFYLSDKCCEWISWKNQRCCWKNCCMCWCGSKIFISFFILLLRSFFIFFYSFTLKFFWFLVKMVWGVWCEGVGWCFKIRALVKWMEQVGPNPKQPNCYDRTLLIWEELTDLGNFQAIQHWSKLNYIFC